MTKKQKALAKKFAQTIALEHGYNLKQSKMLLLETSGGNDDIFDYVMFGVGDYDYQATRKSDGTTSFTEYKNGFPTSIEEEIDDLNTATLYIKNEVAGVANSFCRIGFKLYDINRNNLFKLANFNNIYEYAEQYFGFKKSSVANYISICKRFSVKDENGLPTCVLADNFETFSYTQLSEMLTLPAEKLDEISPDMTIKEIRTAKASGVTLTDETEETEDNAGLYAVSIFDRKLTEDNIDLVISLLRENIGSDIQITKF